MLPFWPFFGLALAQPLRTRQSRLQDLDARMASYLAEKQAAGASCPLVLDNVRAARSAVQRELTGHS